MPNLPKRFFHRNIGSQKVSLKNFKELPQDDSELAIENSQSIKKIEMKNEVPNIVHHNSPKSWILIIICLMTSGILFFCLTRILSPETKPTLPTKAATQEEIIKNSEIIGKVVETNFFAIDSEVKGLVKDVYVKVGDTVKPWQKIADLLPDPEEKQKRSEALNNYLIEKKNLEAEKMILGQRQEAFNTAHLKFMTEAVGHLSENDGHYQELRNQMQQTEGAYKKEQALVVSMQRICDQLWLEYDQGLSAITATVAGTIAEINLVPGEEIPQRTVIIRTQGQVKLSFVLSSDQAAKFTPGQEMAINFADYPGKIFSGKVSMVENNLMTIILNEPSDSILVTMPPQITIF